MLAFVVALMFTFVVALMLTFVVAFVVALVLTFVIAFVFAFVVAFIATAFMAEEFLQECLFTIEAHVFEFGPCLFAVGFAFGFLGGHFFGHVCCLGFAFFLHRGKFLVGEGFCVGDGLSFLLIVHLAPFGEVVHNSLHFRAASVFFNSFNFFYRSFGRLFSLFRSVASAGSEKADDSASQ